MIRPTIPADTEFLVPLTQATGVFKPIEIEALKEAHAGEVNAQREALEKDKIATVNAERAGFLKVRMKFEEDLADMQRRLQQKTAHEHGEWR